MMRTFNQAYITELLSRVLATQVIGSIRKQHASEIEIAPPEHRSLQRHNAMQNDYAHFNVISGDLDEQGWSNELLPYRRA